MAPREQEGALLSFERRGRGPQTLVFVHGSFATHRWWLPVMAQLDEAAFSCYLPDLRGCGGSPRDGGAEDYRIERQAGDLARLLDHLRLDQIHLVGHSLGAAICLAYALGWPGRLRSLTLVAMPSPAGTATPPEALDLLERMRGDRALLLQAMASTMPARAADDFMQRLVDDAMGQAPAAFTANAQALADWRVPAEELTRLRLPVLLAWGDQDQFVPREVQRQLLLAIPGANNLEVFRGCGHSPMLERPAGFVEALRAFVEQDFDHFAAIRVNG